MHRHQFARCPDSLSEGVLFLRFFIKVHCGSSLYCLDPAKSSIAFLTGSCVTIAATGNSMYICRMSGLLHINTSLALLFIHIHS